MPHAGQNELLKKTGMDRNLARSMCMPVVTGFPVFGQRIMSHPSPTPQMCARRAMHDAYESGKALFERRLDAERLQDAQDLVADRRIDAQAADRNAARAPWFVRAPWQL